MISHVPGFPLYSGLCRRQRERRSVTQELWEHKVQRAASSLHANRWSILAKPTLQRSDVMICRFISRWNRSLWCCRWAWVVTSSGPGSRAAPLACLLRNTAGFSLPGALVAPQGASSISPGKSWPWTPSTRAEPLSGSFGPSGSSHSPGEAKFLETEKATDRRKSS